MAIETHQLMAATAGVINHKRMAQALAVSLSHTYVLCADPMAHDAPVRNDADRLVNLLTELATHRNGRPALVMWRMFWKEFFARVIDGEKPEPLTCETIIPEAQQLCAHFSDVLKECKPGFVPDHVAQEAAEMIAKLEQLVACAEAADDSGVAQARRLRVQ
jgi:hypothetical protein